MNKRKIGKIQLTISIIFFLIAFFLFLRHNFKRPSLEGALFERGAYDIILTKRGALIRGFTVNFLYVETKFGKQSISCIYLWLENLVELVLVVYNFLLSPRKVDESILYEIQNHCLLLISCFQTPKVLVGFTTYGYCKKRNKIILTLRAVFRKSFFCRNCKKYYVTKVINFTIPILLLKPE